jgi:hypothetical protein
MILCLLTIELCFGIPIVGLFFEESLYTLAPFLDETVVP